MKKINENIDYELFVKQIYESIIGNEGYQNVTVLHDVRIEGKSGRKHQIDVYWELNIAGEIQKFAIECKNYSRLIQIGKIRDFFGVLHDIGNIKGIMVTKKGFQNGAKEFADYHGISLREIRKPKEEDWNGRVRKTQFDIVLQTIKIKKVDLNLDESWLKEKLGEFQKSEIWLLSNMNEEIVIFKENGVKDFDFREMENKIPRKSKKESDLIYEFNFSQESRFVDTSIGRVKVHNVIVIYDENPIKSELVIDAFTITDAIFKDIQSGSIKFIRYEKEE